jgi:hypothetical protein
MEDFDSKISELFLFFCETRNGRQMAHKEATDEEMISHF